MANNCVKWADRPVKAACEGWGDAPRPDADWDPEHGLDGCEDWRDKDVSLSADYVTTIDESLENQIVLVDGDNAVIKTNPSGRTPA